MSDVQTNVSVGVESASIRAVVLKCTCGNPESHLGQVCPQAIAIPQGLDGLVAHYNRDPNKQYEFNVRLAEAEGRPYDGPPIRVGSWKTGKIRGWVIRTLLKWRSKL